jgi:hypothetical protein
LALAMFESEDAQHDSPLHGRIASVSKGSAWRSA